MHPDWCLWHVRHRNRDCSCELAAPTRHDRIVSPGRARTREDNQVVNAPQCGERFAPGWHCTRAEGHDGPCAAWPRKAWNIPATAPAKQSKADSFMESLTNIAVGLVVSQVANFFIIPAVLGVAISQRESFALGAAYTVVSLVRSYALRRAFNGRTVWSAIKGVFA